VAHIHTEILKTREMKNFYNVYPHKFNNKTNGITHRRWLLKANPKLAGLITETIGPGWVRHPDDLTGLLKYTRDKGFQEKLALIKRENKQALAAYIKEKQGIMVDESSIFDVQIKRLHAYKRQVMNALYIMDLYNKLKENPDLDINPRTFIFGAKASPSYDLAKRVIKLINSLAEVVNRDKAIRDKIKVVFMENYRVSLAEIIIPAAEVSQQISTASKEASGTGNMKLMMNGALTLGTLDGANIEILEEVGKDNIFTFGLTPREVLDFYHYGGYSSQELCQEDPRMEGLLKQMVSSFFPAGREEFYPIYEALLDYNDEYFVLKDFAEYAKAQEKVDETYNDRGKWLEMSINNIARSGRFSSDRTISEYAAGIWNISPVYNSD
jgi:glycogen phosphorylase